jgi:hypothetical protein
MRKNLDLIGKTENFNDCVDSILDEAEEYMEFAEEYNRKNNITGPFDDRFRNNKKAQQKYLKELGKAWNSYKREKINSGGKDTVKKK